MDIWDVIFLLPFFASLYIFIKSPLTTRYTTASWADPIAGFLFIFISLIYFYVAYISDQMGPEPDKSPCAKMSKQIECYNINETTCQAAWSSSHGDCDDRLVKILKTRPSFLSGNFLESCIGRNFDKMMHYNRKYEASFACQSYFNKIDKRD